MARDDSSDSQEGKDDDDSDVNLLAMQMQRYQYHSLPTFTELWTIWSLVDSTCYDINGRDNLGVPPIVYAAKRGSVILLRLLLNYHADINAMSSIRETAVMAACRKQKHRAVHLLIRRGARLELIDRSQFSALRWASTHGDVSLVRLLLKHKVSVTADCYTANSALEIAMAQPTKKHAKIALLLQQQLVVERRQLLHDVIKQKERAEIDEIKRHRRRMRRLARQEKEKQHDSGASDQPVASTPKPADRSPFSLPIIPILKKKLRDPHLQLEGGGSVSRGTSKRDLVVQPPLPVVVLQHALQSQLVPPAMVWVKASRGQWRQVEAHKHKPPTQVLPVTVGDDAVVDLSPVSIEQMAHQLIKGESKWRSFMQEKHSSTEDSDAKGDNGHDTAMWTVEDLE